MNPKSKKPRKQRAFLRRLALHQQHKRLSIHASASIRKEIKKRRLPARKGDTVKVLRGQFKGKQGKISRVAHRTGSVFIEKLLRKKSDGKEIMVPVQASNLLLTELNREDEVRFGKKPVKGKKAKAKKETPLEKENAKKVVIGEPKKNQAKKAPAKPSDSNKKKISKEKTKGEK